VGDPYSANVRVRAVSYDDPDAGKLIAELQQEYVRRYGGVDGTPVTPEEFTAPLGLFLLGYVDGVAVASGGWRGHTAADPGFSDGDAEVKRMYVVPAQRGRGLARELLAELERTAAHAGYRRLVLETGLAQPEAIGLYRSAGYTPIEKFGLYRRESGSRCFGKILS
jgi:GNAT superfamily N-acetyltransferase